MEKSKVKCISEKLNKFDYCVDNEDDMIYVTQWPNMEGWDINIEQGNSSRQFQLTIGELQAINYLTDTIDLNDDEGFDDDDKEE